MKGEISATIPKYVPTIYYSHAHILARVIQIVLIKWMNKLFST